MSNKKEKEEKKTFINKIKDYSPSVIGILTFLGVICFNILKFTEYIKVQFYFSYYGLDDNLYKYSDQSFIYSLCLSVIFVLALFSLLFCFKQIFDNYKGIKRVILDNWDNLLLILVSNIYIAYCYSLDKSIRDIIITFIVSVVELLFSYFVFKKINSEKNDLDRSLVDYLKFVPFYIILLILCIGFSGFLNLSLKKEYRIINDNKVIVYSNNDYYLILDCEIKKNKLIMYKGKQNKVGTDNIYSELKEFNVVEMKKR